MYEEKYEKNIKFKIEAISVTAGKGEALKAVEW